MKSTKRLRQILQEGKVTIAAGAYDSLSAKLVAGAGFKLLNTTGLSISASLIGKPDAGYLTLTQNLMAVKGIVESVDIPVVSDVDTGYGNAINVMHTVMEFEKCGAAGLSIEDQVEPKRCPVSVSNAVESISIEEMAGKIKAAVDARRDPDFVIIARTDARGEEAIRRGQAYAEAGADMIKPTSKAFDSLADLKKFISLMHKPVWISMVGWIGAKLGIADFAATNCRIASFALVPILTAARAIQEALKIVREKGASQELAGNMFTISDLQNLMGMPQVLDWEEKYLSRR